MIMSIQRQNKIHTWVVRTLMTMVLIVALCTFYFFMIQSSFGLNVSNSREAKKDLIVISCYPGANNPWKTDVIKSVADTIMRKKLELRNYVLTIPYNNTFLYKKGVSDIPDLNRFPYHFQRKRRHLPNSLSPLKCILQ